MGPISFKGAGCPQMGTQNTQQTQNIYRLQGKIVQYSGYIVTDRHKRRTYRYGYGGKLLIFFSLFSYVRGGHGDVWGARGGTGGDEGNGAWKETRKKCP